MSKNTLDYAVPFITRFEGGQSHDGLFHAYYDRAGGVWTQGFGHTHGVTASSRPWTPAKAAHVLRHDLIHEYLPAVNRLPDDLPGRLSPRQKAALLSLVYNLGPGILGSTHTVGQELRAHHFAKAANSFLLYDRAANGQQLPGLSRRRRAERRLFLRGSNLRTRLRAALPRR